MRPKYEREIEEILEKLDEPPPASTGRVLTPVRPLESPPRPPRRRPSLPIRISPSGLMVAALVLAVVSAPLQSIYPPAVALVGVLAVGLFVGSLAMSVARLGRPRATPMWRGREVRTGGFFANTPIARQWRRWRARRRFRDTRWS
ncbi:MAG TPA: hypothetical protein VGM69_08080 [Chloroflexota bacterium]